MYDHRDGDYDRRGAMKYDIYDGARGTKFVCDTQGGPVFSAISIAADAPIVSCAREPACKPWLRRLGKKDQGTLWECFNNCRPSCGGDCNPANPPGRSTHERRNDGAAYAFWPAFFPLPWWARGIDVQIDRVPAFIAEGREQGFTITLTYPGNPRETQHVNFRKAPKVNWWKLRPVKRGMRAPRGSRARYVIWLLRKIREYQKGVPFDMRKPYLDNKHAPYTKIGAYVEDAIKDFQRKHGQRPDGVVGIHAIRSMQAAYRRQKKEHKR
jgi:hypothetical protein